MGSKKNSSAGTRKTPRDKIKLPDYKKQKGLPDTKASPDSIPEEKYYDLKTQAVEDLVTANSENSPPVSPAELRKYHAGPRIRIADWLKAILLKIWFAGVICYFFIWGLSTFTLNQWDHITVIALALGAITNLITNNILRFISKTPGAYDRWMMVPQSKIWFLPLDLIYALFLVLCVLMTYNFINTTAARITGNTESAFLGVEPILFGIFTTAWDLLFIGMKRLLKRIISDAKQSARK